MATCAGCPAELPPSTGVVGRERKWCSERCRRRTSYGGQCVDCGGPTSGSNGLAKTSKRCVPCCREWQHGHATWTRERLIAEAHRWHDLTGWWPTATHWHTTCGGLGSSEEFRAAVLAFRALTGPWPMSSTACESFGSWAAFMEAVGGMAVGRGARGVKDGQRVAEMSAALDALRDR